MNWLRPVPPIENGQAQLQHPWIPTRWRSSQPAAGSACATRGKAARGACRLLRRQNAHHRHHAAAHQVGAIEADIAGSLPDTLALRRCASRACAAARPSSDRTEKSGRTGCGEASASPSRCRTDVQMDDVAIRAQAHLDGVHLSALVAGRDLDQGVFDLSANPDGMKLEQARSAGVDSVEAGCGDGLSRWSADADLVQSVTASATARDARQLAAAGLDATSVMAGPAGDMQAVLSRTTERPRRCGGDRRPRPALELFVCGNSNGASPALPRRKRPRACCSTTTG